MRILTLMMTGVLAACSLLAQPVDKYSAERTATVTSGVNSGLAAWIWTEKYTFLANQAVTLRWTIKTNNDLYPYTVFVYKQNNQTGEKRYFPGNTLTPTDIAGKTAGNYEARKLTDVTKQVLLGAGGAAGPAWTSTTEYGMHTFIVEFRDYNGGRIIKTLYMKIGVVRDVQTIDATAGAITTSRTLTNDIEWRIRGLIYVKNGAVLTIEPGTFVLGEGIQGGTAIIITREATIEARGTADRPIILTSSRNFGVRQRGDWGGLALLGKARINVAAGVSGGNPVGEFYFEGLTTNPDALFGGQDDTHYCGTLTYVRSEFAGFELAPSFELNSVTFGGCGSKTVVHHVQAQYGLDDAFEWFGGTVSAKYLVGGLAKDDFIDFQLGYRGTVQHAVVYQGTAAINGHGNRGIEGDNSEYEQLAPLFSNPTLANLTIIGSGEAGADEGSSHGAFLRRGARASIYNSVITRFRSGGVHVDDANTEAQVTGGNLKMNGLLLWNNNTATTTVNTVAGNINSARGVTLINASANVIAEDPLFVRPFEYSDPDFFGRSQSPIFRAGWVGLPDPSLENARYLGAFGSYDWTEGWTFWVTEKDMEP